ncbi:MAG: hypothetical protein HY337_03485 [Gemmatimonadetes bacterium]|nr:hypothetical protein [Gemmatimonadota bacterium]
MSRLDDALALIDALSVPERQMVLRHLRRALPPHPMEARLKASAETLLEAIKRASPLTIRGIEGILAEASFAMEVLPTLPGWEELPPEPDASYDFLLTDGTQVSPVRLQVKMQRRKNHQPWMANQAMKKTRSWPAEYYVVEVQRTRGGTDTAGKGTRPYRFEEFDILGVSLGAAKGEWRHFTYTVARWLLPEPDDPNSILKYQPVAPFDNQDWTSEFVRAVAWHRSGIARTIAGSRVGA